MKQSRERCFQKLKKRSKKKDNCLKRDKTNSSKLYIYDLNVVNNREKEQKLAEERIKKINEEQNKLQKKKDQSKEFYMKFLKKTNEVNKQRLEVKQQ